MRGCFVTGTDTGVGKTVVAAAIAAGASARGIAVSALKPVITGLEESAPPEWPHDHELLARAIGRVPDDVALLSYGPAVSPHLAAELDGAAIDTGELERRIAAASEGAGVVVVEGVGGLLVPLNEAYDVRRLAASLRLPLVIVARPGLGTINHTLLTLEAARAAGLQTTAVVLTPWPESPGAIETSNRATIAALGHVAVEVLPRIARADRDLLAAAAQSLPLERWLSAWRVHDRGPSDRGEE